MPEGAFATARRERCRVSLSWVDRQIEIRDRSFEGITSVLGRVAFSLCDAFPNLTMPEELVYRLLPVIEARELIGDPHDRLCDFLSAYSVHEQYLQELGIDPH